MAMVTGKTDSAAIEARRKYIEAWNGTLINIWRERIFKLGVVDTGSLYRSPEAAKPVTDQDYYSVEMSDSFIEYGLWQELGVGREVYKGNPGDIGREKKRQRRPWMSPKYYMSAMNLKEFMAESLGEQFVGMVAASLDTDNIRNNTNYYKSKGWA